MLAGQLGAKGFHFNTPPIAENDEKYWTVRALKWLKEYTEKFGLTLDMIENVPIRFLDKIIMGLPGRDEQIENYIKNHEEGKIPINKCFNDLFGIRIICNEELSFDKIVKLINNKYSNLKCIDSSKNEYKATHIYFKKDNFTFQWELQVWNKTDEIRNINSHEKYKQDYIKWENENKERG